MKKVLLAIAITAFSICAYQETLGAANKAFTFSSQQVATGDAVSWEFSGASKYSYIDFYSDTYTTASIKYVLPYNITISTNILTKGVRMPLYGADTVKVRMDVTRNAVQSGSFLLHN